MLINSFKDHDKTQRILAPVTVVFYLLYYIWLWAVLFIVMIILIFTLHFEVRTVNKFFIFFYLFLHVFSFFSLSCHYPFKASQSPKEVDLGKYNI